MLCFRGAHHKYHDTVGVAVDDIAGGGDEVWEQAISKFKQRISFGYWEMGKRKFCSREVIQTAEGSMRAGQPVYIKSLDFVPLGKLRKEQSGRCQRKRKNCHEVGAGSSRVFSP